MSESRLPLLQTPRPPIQRDYPELIRALSKSAGIPGKDEALSIRADARPAGANVRGSRELHYRRGRAGRQLIQHALAAIRSIAERDRDYRSLIGVGAWMNKRTRAGLRFGKKRLSPSGVEI